MKVGDLLRWADELWFVRKIERETKSALLFGLSGPEVVRQDLDTTAPDVCTVVCNPLDDWPFITLAPKANAGSLKQILVPRASGLHPLRPLADWVKGDIHQMGGAVFLNPELGIGYGDIVLAEFEKKRLRVTIPRTFGTANEKRAKAAEAAAQEEPRTSFDRLIDDEDPFEDT